MTDFTTLKLQVNTGASDASPTWTDLLFGTANYELRAAISGAAGNIASASWPSMLKPLIGTTLIGQLWGYFGSDNSGGLQVTTYDGTGAHYNQFRINWDALGTFASAPLISAWKDNTLPAASPGTQTSPGDGSNVVNGTSGESSSTSLLKGTAFGNGVTAGGAADNPGSNFGTNPTATSGSAGGSATINATWLAWQSLQAATQWIVNGAIPKATTAGTWNFLLAFYLAASMIGGILLPVLGFQYTWI